MFFAWKCHSEGGLIAFSVDGDENALEKLFAYVFSNAKCVTSSTLRQSEAASLLYSALLGASEKINNQKFRSVEQKVKLGPAWFEWRVICNS